MSLLWPCPQILRPDWKGFPRANPLANWTSSSVTKEKSFITLTPIGRGDLPTSRGDLPTSRCASTIGRGAFAICKGTLALGRGTLPVGGVL